MDRSELLDRLISILLPHRCVICGDLVEYEDYWCETCASVGETPYTRTGQVVCAIPHGFAGALARLIGSKGQHASFGDKSKWLSLQSKTNLKKKRPTKRYRYGVPQTPEKSWAGFYAQIIDLWYRALKIFGE